MDRPKLYEKRYEDGVLHLIGEYRCTLCRSILILDLGEVEPPSEEFPEVVEGELIIE